MDAGKLVPDTLLIDIIKDRLAKDESGRMDAGRFPPGPSPRLSSG